MPPKTPSIFQEHYNLLRECLIEVDNHCILQIDRDLLWRGKQEIEYVEFLGWSHLDFHLLFFPLAAVAQAPFLTWATFKSAAVEAVPVGHQFCLSWGAT